MYLYRLMPRASLLAAGVLLGACTPTVQVAMPNEPITINLNVKIEHEILVKVDREIDSLLEENSNLF
uniref:YnbE family lipoprotein n=1 Tax=Marinobacterium profundum TaxID=1714300 RepID=UPI000832F0FC|nr:YnbE family lipoprotein [Marinobacterium profundum]